MKQFKKDPDSVNDYLIDWSGWLPEGDTIAGSTFAADSDDIHIDSSAQTTTTTTVWVSGGAAGRTHNIVNHITTADGRQEDETLQFFIEER
jgi:hypothetical protein